MQSRRKGVYRKLPSWSYNDPRRPNEPLSLRVNPHLLSQFPPTVKVSKCIVCTECPRCNVSDLRRQRNAIIIGCKCFNCRICRCVSEKASIQDRSVFQSRTRHRPLDASKAHLGVTTCSACTGEARAAHILMQALSDDRGGYPWST